MNTQDGGHYDAAVDALAARRYETAVTDGHLAAPRGTTEYGNETHRCPNCGANDINWAGTDVLCMRCSTPTERV